MPDQWAWPWTGAEGPRHLRGRRPGRLGLGRIDDPDDFRDEFEVKLLRPAQRLGLGYAASEAAVYHKPLIRSLSRTRS